MDELAVLLGHTVDTLRGSPFVDRSDDIEWIGDRGYLNLRDRGLSLVLDEDRRVLAVQLYGAGQDGFAEWSGPMPASLSFSAGRTAFRARLGDPVRSAGVRVAPILGARPAWDLFRWEFGLLNVQYEVDPEAGVRLVSLLPPDQP